MSARIVILVIAVIVMNAYLIQLVLLRYLLVALAIGMESVTTINTVAAIMGRQVTVFS